MRMRQSEGASELIRKVSPQWLSIDEATYIIIYLPSTQSIVRCNIILPFFSSCLSLALFRFLHRNCEWQKVHFSFQLRGKSERGKGRKARPRKIISTEIICTNTQKLCWESNDRRGEWDRDAQTQSNDDMGGNLHTKWFLRECGGWQSFINMARCVLSTCSM